MGHYGQRHRVGISGPHHMLRYLITARLTTLWGATDNLRPRHQWQISEDLTGQATWYRLYCGSLITTRIVRKLTGTCVDGVDNWQWVWTTWKGERAVDLGKGMQGEKEGEVEKGILWSRQGIIWMEWWEGMFECQQLI